jgi:uncharacterized Zn finger protein
VWFVRESVTEKADRLLSSGQVRILHLGADRVVARVEGDHGVYCVASSVTRPMECSCPAGERQVRCSHLIAVELITVVEPAEA